MNPISFTLFSELVTFALFIPIEMLVCIYVLMPAVGETKISAKRKVAFVLLSSFAFWISYSINNPTYA